MKKTLLVTLEYPPDIGGVASYYSNLITQLPQDDITVLTNKNSTLLPWHKSFYAIKQAIKEGVISTVLIGQILPLGTVVALLSYFYPIQFIVFIHGMDITVPQKYMRKRILLKWILRRASHIVTVSHYTASRIQTLIGSKKTPLSIISPAAHITPAVRKADTVVALPKQFILSVGRLVERKGFDKSIEAFARIHTEFPDMQYIIAGSGSDESRLRALISSLELESTVHIRTGLSDSEIAELYAHCTIVTMPTRVVDGTDFEGYGITVLEANMFGKPVIGGNDSGMTDVISQGMTGWLVDGNSVEQIGKVMLEAIHNPEMVKMYGATALHIASEPKMHWKSKAKLLENIIQEIQ